MPLWTHLIRFLAVEDSGATIHLGQLVDTTRDVGLDSLNGTPIKAYRIHGDSIFDKHARPTTEILTVKQLLAPVARAQCGYIRCIGMNYRTHAKEIDVALPSAPSMFTKPRTSLCDPYPAPLSIPKIAQDQTSDYEAELCVVIGKDGRNIPKDNAFEYILGYTVSNDVSSRDLQMSSQQWSFSKGLDVACPIGPVLVSTQALPEPQKLRLQAVYNGTVVQDDTTSNMVFNIAELVAYLSQGTTLEAGSLILTGTTHGVGFKRNPKVFLEDGSDIRVYVEGIGTLVNRVKYEDW